MKHQQLFDAFDGPELESLFPPMATLLQQQKPGQAEEKPSIPVCSQVIEEEKAAPPQEQPEEVAQANEQSTPTVQATAEETKDTEGA